MLATPPNLRPGDGAGIFPATALGPLRDLPHKVPLEPALESELQAFLTTPPPNATDREALAPYVRSAEAVVEKVIAFLDAEMTRTVEAKFALGDANSLQRRAVAEPKQQAQSVLNELKARLAAEKTKWTQRTKDQAQDVLDKLEEQMRSFGVGYDLRTAEVVITVQETWKLNLFKWLDGVLSQWAAHHNHILEGKTRLALEPSVQDFNKACGATFQPRISAPLPASGKDLEQDLPPLTHEEEIATKMEAFLESLKGGLNTVAMLAGMVIVPVVGMFSDQQPIRMRAAIMAGCVLPIILFSAWATRRQREKEVEKSEEKGLQVLKKDFESYLKTRIERFRVELERHAGDYLASVQSALSSQLDEALNTSLHERESQLGRELARVQIEADRLGDRLLTLKQSRGALSGQLMVEIRKRLRDTQGP